MIKTLCVYTSFSFLTWVRYVAELWVGQEFDAQAAFPVRPADAAVTEVETLTLNGEAVAKETDFQIL